VHIDRDNGTREQQAALQALPCNPLAGFDAAAIFRNPVPRRNSFLVVHPVKPLYFHKHLVARLTALHGVE
jgi:hypothetical protein